MLLSLRHANKRFTYRSMRIGIDISQLTYSHTGVANYLKNLIKNLIELDSENEYVLFYSSLRGKLELQDIPQKKNVKLVKSFFPPTALDLIWNKLHILPIETFTGPLDIFITSDWVEPPTRKAKKVTILYDLIVYKYPEESHNKTEFKLSSLILFANIVKSQKRRLKWVQKESDAVLCISEATKKDASELLHIDPSKLHVIYPGFTL